MAEEVIEAEATEVGTELEPVAGQTLFRTDDPAEVLTRATATAKATTHFAQWPRHGRPPRRSLQSCGSSPPWGGASGTPAEEMSGVRQGDPERGASEKQRNYASSLIVEDFHRDGSFGVVGYDECWIAECPVHGAIGDADTEQLARAFDCPLCVQDRYGLPAIEREPVDSRGL